MKSKTISICFIVLSFIGCKKESAVNMLSNEFDNSDPQFDIGSGEQHCTGFVTEFQEHVVNNEVELNNLINSIPSGQRTHHRIKLKGDASNRFFITGIPFNPSPLIKPMDKNVIVFDGWSYLEITSFNLGTPTDIIFQPRIDSKGQNNRMMLFRNCNNVAIHDLNIYTDHNNLYDATGTNPQVVHDNEYYGSTIAFTYRNHDVEVFNVKFQGTDDNTVFHGEVDDPTDLWVTGAISSGLGYSDLGNYISYENVPDSWENTNFCIHNNHIMNYRAYGFYLTRTDNMQIEDNRIEYIWEVETNHRSDAAAIHVAYTNGTNILRNYIRSVFSLWDKDDIVSDHQNLHERHQHGIYLSTASDNVTVAENEVRYISGAAIHIWHANPMKNNITVSGNVLYYAMNHAILVQGVNRLKIFGNSFYHCGYKILPSLPYHFIQTCRPNETAIVSVNNDVIDLEFHNNRFKNNISELYSSHKTSYSSGLPSNELDIRLAVFVDDEDPNTNSAINDITNRYKCFGNEICLEYYNSSTAPGQNPSLLRFGPASTPLYKYDDIKSHPSYQYFFSDLYWSSGSTNCNW